MTIVTTSRQAADDRRAVPNRPAVPNGAARSLPFAAELRAKLEARNGKQLIHLSGVASVTDTPYEMWDDFGPYEETVAASAFTDTLAAEPDVSFLVNHRGITMARTTNDTLNLALDDDEGLRADAWLNPERQDVKDLVVAIDDKNIDQMSFAFRLDEGIWNEDFTRFEITKLDINRGDVSAVNYGANPYTSIAARQLEILDDLQHLPAGAQRAALARLTGLTNPAPVRAPQPATAPAPGRSVAGVTAWLQQNA